MSDFDGLVDEFARFRDDPVYGVQSLFGVDPTPQQAQLLRAAAVPGAHVSVRSGHGTGKTTSLAWLILLFILTHEDSRVPCTAPTGHQLQSVLWAEIAKWHSRMPPGLRDQISVNADVVRIRGAEHSQFAIGRTARKENPEALQGFHAEHLMFVVDEASGVPDPIFHASEGALSTPGARVILTSNPTQTSGYFYDTHHRDRDAWTGLHFSCLDSPLVAPEYVAKMQAKYGEDSDIYKIRVAGDFPSASARQLIPRDLAEEAGKRHLRVEEYGFAPTAYGLDVARYGDCKSVLMRRQGLWAKLVRWWGKTDLMAIADSVAGHMVVDPPQACFIDTGMGAGVIDRLRQLGWKNVIDVVFGAASGDPRFANKRAEMWWAVKDWLEAGGVIPPEDALVDDLCGPEYFFTPSGKIMLESKEDMMDRGLPSPDYGDALATTFYLPMAPVGTRPDTRPRDLKQRTGQRVNPLSRLDRR